MRIKQESAINQAIHCDEEIYRAGARIVTSQSFVDLNDKIRNVVMAIVDKKQQLLLIDKLARNGVNI